MEKGTDKVKQFKRIIAFAFYLVIIAIALAYYEIQIEGPNGWAAALPTWRTTDKSITWIFGGRPVTGYHVALNVLLLLFLHFPAFFTKWSLHYEAKVLSSYAILGVIWDFLWFVMNPDFGLTKYNGSHIWWFQNWLFGIPVDYYFGILMAILLGLLPALTRKVNFRKIFINDLLMVFSSLIFTTIFTITYHLLAH